MAKLEAQDNLTNCKIVDYNYIAYTAKCGEVYHIHHYPQMLMYKMADKSWQLDSWDEITVVDPIGE